MRLALGVLVIGLSVSAAAAADMIFVHTREEVDGKEAALPLPGLEGILDALFETSHVAIESGPGGAAVDWEREDFQPAAALAGQAAADHLLVVRFTAGPAAGGPPPGGPAAGGQPAGRAVFWLLRPADSRVLARGELALDGAGRPGIDGRRLCFELGRQAADRVARLLVGLPAGE